MKKRDRLAAGQQNRLSQQESALLCMPCLMLGTTRRAWTVNEGRACCIRHAVDDSELDDMQQHDLFAEIYEKLRLQGFPDAY